LSKYSTVLRIPEPKEQGEEILPPWPRAKKIVPQSCLDLKITRWGRSEEEATVAEWRRQ